MLWLQHCLGTHICFMVLLDMVYVIDASMRSLIMKTILSMFCWLLCIADLSVDHIEQCFLQSRFERASNLLSLTCLCIDLMHTSHLSALLSLSKSYSLDIAICTRTVLLL